MDEKRRQEKINEDEEERLLPIEKKFVIWCLITGLILWAVLALLFGYPMNH